MGQSAGQGQDSNPDVTLPCRALHRDHDSLQQTRTSTAAMSPTRRLARRLRGHNSLISRLIQGWSRYRQFAWMVSQPWPGAQPGQGLSPAEPEALRQMVTVTVTVTLTCKLTPAGHAGGPAPTAG